MRDFASFTPQGKPDGEWMKEAEALMREYAGRSETELVRAIYARAAEGKRAGTLTNEQIDAFAAQISALLDPPKRKQLEKLVSKLKNL